MNAKSIDAAEFRDKQRDQWNGAATGWNEWSSYTDDQAGTVCERLVEMADITEGDRVLDVAAGYGEPSLTAARKVGPEGSVIATDISAEMLDFGRQRAAANGVENIEFMQSDANSLDFPAESFDAAVSRWGIIFDPDGEGAAAKVRGFLKPGSRFAISSWGPPERVPFLAIAMKTAMERLDVPPPPPGPRPALPADRGGDRGPARGRRILGHRGGGARGHLRRSTRPRSTSNTSRRSPRRSSR